MARSIKTVGEDGSARTVTFVTDAMCSAEEPELISATPISAVEMDMLEESFDEKITSATNKAIDIEGGVKDVASEEPSTSTPRQNRRHLAISPTSWAEVQREAPALQPCVSPSSVTAMSSLTARLEVDSANNVLKDADARNAAGSVNESDRVGTADIKSEISFEPTSIPTPESEPGGSDSVLAQPQEVLGAAYRAALRADGAARIRELHALGHNMNMTVDARTPLQAAAWLGHAEVITALHLCGASLERRDQHGCAALHFASAQGNLAAVTALLEAGASVATASTAGDTPLHTAASAGAASVVKLLVLRGGADSCSVNRSQRTPLHLAASNGHVEACEALLELGADVCASAKDGACPLHCAAMYGHAKVVSVLVGRGAATEARTVRGECALHLACDRGHAEAAAALVKLKAKAHALDGSGYTPLQLAALRGHASVCGAMARVGASLAKSVSGRTPASVAASAGWGELASLLESAADEQELGINGSIDMWALKELCGSEA